MNDNEQYNQGYNTGWNMGANGWGWDTTGLDTSDTDFLEGLEQGYDDGYEIYLECLDDEDGDDKEGDYEIECFLDEDSNGNTLQ